VFYRDQSFDFESLTRSWTNPWSNGMWTLILVVVVASGAATGGVATTTSFLDFPDEARCKTAAETVAGTNQVTIGQSGTRPNISPPATYRVIAQCVTR
jgi:hypothetical protein